MAKIHMVLQGKGGVGKSFIAATLAPVSYTHLDVYKRQLHCHTQGGLQAVLIGSPRDFQFVAVIAHGRRADAIDDRALLGDAVLSGMALRGLLAALAGHRITRCLLYTSRCV